MVRGTFNGDFNENGTALTDDTGDEVIATVYFPVSQ